ncbi:MAG TPA: single-stranded-DNA-specific exonuclease RecJ, partial [Ktedonobacter sp.]|nr:single-stranded-DNA-specific exonuclease RecJ [Ktedonobacter sp.]
MELASQTKTPWDVYDILSDAQFQQYSQAGIEAIHAQLLHNRGIITPEAMRSFLAARYDQTPDPLTLIDMSKVLERIQRALAQQEHITVYGDYDADGVTSSALLTRAL